jgi:hypothetical protein
MRMRWLLAFQPPQGKPGLAVVGGGLRPPHFKGLAGGEKHVALGGLTEATYSKTATVADRRYNTTGYLCSIT